MSFPNDGWLSVAHNLRQARGKWGRLVKILWREWGDRRAAGRFYVAVVQSVILGGSETWVVTPHLDKSLTGFYHQAV